MLKYIFFVIAFFAFTFVSIAQRTSMEKISGTIITTDGQPAEYITVALKETTYGSVSDENGYFEFEAPTGEYTMVVYSISAHRKEYPISIKNGTNYFSDLTILENKNLLEEVIVTGQFSPQSLRNSLYKVRVINNKTIQQKASTDLQSLLNTEIGIRISNNLGLGESTVELMGMGGNNIKILLDGIPLIDRGSTKQSLSQIDINNIDQIEIVEGPMSVIYGTDALAGVINIITKKARVLSDRNTYSISGRIQEESVGDEYKLLSGKGIHNENINATWASKMGLYLNGAFTRNILGGWTGDKIGREKKWSPRDQYYYEGTLGFKKKGLNIWYRLNYLNEKIYAPLNPTDVTPTWIVDSDFLTDRYTHSFQADYKLGNRWIFNLVSSYQDYERKTKTIVTDIETLEKWLSTDDAAQDIQKFKSSFVRATASWKATSTLSLQPGIEYSWDKGSGGRIKGNPSISTLATFLSAEWKALEWLSLRPGIRTILSADYDAKFAIPSIGTKLSLNSDMDLRMSYSYGFRAPTLQELYFSFHNASHNIDGNPDLKAEHSHNFSGSLTWRIFHNQDIRLTSTISAFYNDFKDRISTIEDDKDATHYIYKNIDKYKTTGGTLENSVIWRNLQANLGFSLVGRYNSLSDDDNLKDDNLPKFRFSPELNTSISYEFTKSGTNLNLYYKFTGSRHEYWYNSDTKELHLGGLNSYSIADFTFGQNIGQYIKLNAGIKNIFNVTNIKNSAQASGHASTGTSSLIGCGRSFFLGINFLLNN